MEKEVIPSTSFKRDDDSSEGETGDNEYGESLTENIPENYENELETDLEKTLNKDKKKRVVKQREFQSKIPLHIKGLMGEANIRFARGDNETAEKMCYEIIRQIPYAYEPYITLSQMYEVSHPEKSLQYLTISAHLNPSDFNQWFRLSQIHIDKGNKKLAVTCLTRAIRASPMNYELHLKRIELLESLGDDKLALRCKVRLLQVYPPNEYEYIMKKAKELAEIFNKEKEYQKAIDVIKIPFTKCREYITPEMINIYLQLLLITKDLSECLDVFVQFCNIDIEVIVLDDSKIQVTYYKVPEDLQIDLRIKFIQCLIYLEAYDFVNELLDPLLFDEENVEKIGDLYIDLVEAFMAMNKHIEAIKLLVPLVKSKNYSLAAIWLKYAECLNTCGMHKQAIESYYTVIQLAPQHMAVRYPLADLLIQSGSEFEALSVLNQDIDDNEVDAYLLIKRIELLKKLNLIDEYFKSWEILLRRHCIIPIHHTEMRVVTFSKEREKVGRINELRELRGDNPVPPFLKSINNEPTVEEEYQLVKEMLNFAYKNGYYHELKKFSFAALSSFRLKSSLDIYYSALLSCIITKQNYVAYVMIKELLVKNNNDKNNLLWNMFNLSIQTTDITRYNRFILLQSKSLDFSFLKILEANNALSVGSYKAATVNLINLLKNNPTPFIYLLLGVVFTHISFQKNKDIRKKLAQCSYGLFLNYAQKRGKAAYHEVCYNLGRMYQQYGIQHLAVFYYKKVFEFSNPILDEHPKILDLKRESAYNLCLIYCDSENYIGTRNIMNKYLVI